MTFIRRWGPLSSLLLGAAISTTARPAAACRCNDGLLVSPRASSTDVPLNAVIVVLSGQTPIVLYDLDQNAEVPTTSEFYPGLERIWMIRPNQLLRPNTTFEMRGLQRSPDGGFTKFTTGTTTDDERPSYGGITSFSAQTTELDGDSCRNSCMPSSGPYQILKFDYPPPPADTSFLLLEARAADAMMVKTVPIFSWDSSSWPRRSTNDLCSFEMPSFLAGEEICARIIALDTAGNRSDPSPEICTRALACASPTPENSCTWSDVDECVPLAPGGGCSLPRNAPHGGSPRAVSILPLMAALAAATFARRRVQSKRRSAIMDRESSRRAAGCSDREPSSPSRCRSVDRRGA